MALYSSNYSLTAEEQAIFEAGFKNALLNEDSEENAKLFSEWKMKEKALESNKFIGYADIFYDILKNIFLSRKDEIFTSLQDKIKKASDRQDVFVRLFRFNSFEWNESLTEKNRRISLMSADERFRAYDEDCEILDYVKQKNYNWTLGTRISIGRPRYLHDDPMRFPQLKEQSLYKILKKTPILNWMNGLLGPNFECIIERKFLPTEFSDKISVYQASILIRYLPYGHPRKEVLLQIAKDCAEKMNRGSNKLQESEELYGSGTWDLAAMTEMLKM